MFIYPNKTLVPVRIARLIYGFINESLSPDENHELDDWFNLSDDNLEVFDVLTGILEPDETGTPFRILINESSHHMNMKNSMNGLMHQMITWNACL